MEIRTFLLLLCGVYAVCLQIIEAAPAPVAGEVEDELQSLASLRSSEQGQTNLETVIKISDENLSGEIFKMDQESVENVSRERINKKALDPTPTLQEAIKLIKNEVILSRPKNRYVEINTSKPSFSHLERVEVEPLEETGNSDVNSDDDSYTNIYLGEGDPTSNDTEIINFGLDHVKFIPIHTTKSPHNETENQNSSQRHVQILDILEQSKGQSPSFQFQLENTPSLSNIASSIKFKGEEGEEPYTDSQSDPSNSGSRKSDDILLIREIHPEDRINKNTSDNDNNKSIGSSSSSKEISPDAKLLDESLGVKLKITMDLEKEGEKSLNESSVRNNSVMPMELTVNEITKSKDRNEIQGVKRGRKVDSGAEDEIDQDENILGLIPLGTGVTEESLEQFRTSSEISSEYEPLLEELDEDYNDKNIQTVEILLPHADFRGKNNNNAAATDPDEESKIEIQKEKEKDYRSHPFYFLVGPFAMENTSSIPSSFYGFQAQLGAFSSAPFIIHLDNGKDGNLEAPSPADVIQALADKQAYSIFPRLK